MLNRCKEMKLANQKEVRDYITELDSEKVVTLRIIITIMILVIIIIT